MGTDRATLGDMAKKFGVDEKDFADELPGHKVDLKPYYIARLPVTVAQFARFVNATGYVTSAEKAGAAYVLRNRSWQFTPGANWLKPGFNQRDDHPVVMMSWRDAEAFSRWAARETQKALRLPTEAEWEYAARGPLSRLFPWGDAWESKLSNHADRQAAPYLPKDWSHTNGDDGHPFTAEAGRLRNASWCGAMDMCGNVFQWCADQYELYPEKSQAPRILLDPTEAPADAKRVLRGGSYLSSPFECRSGARRQSSPRAASCEFGFRLILLAGDRKQ